MFKILPFLTIALAIIFLLIAALAFSKNWKNLVKTALIITGIFGVAFFYTRYINKLNNQFVPMTSTSMFKKLEYVEKLKLISFYSEEVIVLGTKEKVQKRVDKLTQDSLALDEKKNITNQELDAIIKKLDEATFNQHNHQQQLVQNDESLDHLYENYKELKQASLKNRKLWEYQDDLLDDRNTYSIFKTCWEQHNSLVEEFNSKPWKSNNKAKKINSKTRKVFKDSIAVLRERFLDSKRILTSRLQTKIELAEKHYKNWKRENQRKNNIFNRQRKDATVEIDKARKKWEKAVEQLQKVSYKLQEARIELAFAQEKKLDIEPEILIVVPAKVSSYIDMAAIRIRSDESDTVHILLPPVQMDSVLIDLKDDAIYNLNKDEKEWMATQQGAYFDIFGQLKDAIIEKEQMIKEKARENGILIQGKEMAKSYLENLIHPLGYEVMFENEKLELKD